MNEQVKFVKMKIVICFTAIIIINSFKQAYVLMPILGFIFLLLARNVFNKRIRLKSILQIFLIAFVLAFLQSANIGSTLIYKLNFAGLSISLFYEGVTNGILTLGRVMGSFGCILILTATVRLREFISVLGQLRLPEAFTEVLIFAVKYIFIFREEAGSIRKAQKARLGYANINNSVFSVSNMAGIILIRAFDNSRNLAKSMKSRGYTGNAAMGIERNE